MVVFYSTLYSLHYFQGTDAEEIEGEVLTCADFSLQIRHLPPHENAEEMKVTLYNWVVQ